MGKRSSRMNSLRTAAEATLAGSTPGHVLPRSAHELLHKLQVQQIELEMQNEALRQAKVELEEDCGRYVDLYEFAPVAYLTLTHAGLIAQINMALYVFRTAEDLRAGRPSFR